jgi:hypothetical protein
VQEIDELNKIAMECMEILNAGTDEETGDGDQ